MVFGSAHRNRIRTIGARFVEPGETSGHDSSAGSLFGIGSRQPVGERPVRRSERQTPQFLGPYPAQLLVLEGGRDSLHSGLDEMHQVGRPGIPVRANNLTEAYQAKLQFLQQLSCRGRRSGFPDFDLAARKLPQASVALAGRSPTQQVPVSVTNHGRENI